MMYGIESLLSGRTLADRYLVDEVIGRGGMGVVYRAVDGRLGRKVALKVITGGGAADAASLQRLRARFHREARAAARLHHPNVVAVYDFGTDDALGLDFLVMELLRGEDLAARLTREGPPPYPLALGILQQAARGLAAGHRAGLIHRDVKPGNLFLEPGDRPGEVQVRVLDFGIAEITAEEETLTHLTVFGSGPLSPAFASPEQLRGESGLTPATDVFSLGAVAFYLLTGVRAFISSDAGRALEELAASLGSRLPTIPPPVREIVRRALAPRPGDRYPDAGALAEALALASPSTAPAATVERGLGTPAADLSRSEARPDGSEAASRAGDAGEPRGTRVEADRLPGAARDRSAPLDGTRLYTVASRDPEGPTEAPDEAFAGLDQRRRERERGVLSGLAALGRPPGPPPVRASEPRMSKPPRDWAAEEARLLEARASLAQEQHPAQAPPRRRGRFRRAVRAVWEFLLTLVAVALFVACWAAVGAGLEEGEVGIVYAAAAASVLFAPLAVHRVTGARGSYRFALLGSIVASAGAALLIHPVEELQLFLPLLFVLQLAVSWIVCRVTRRTMTEEELLTA